MWVRKTDEQKAKERRRLWFSFSGPALLFIGGFLAVVVKVLIGSHPPARSSNWPGSWSQIFPRLVVAIVLFAACIGIVVALSGYILQLILGRKILGVGGAKVVMCNTCYRVKRRDRENQCECGGEFEDFDNWTWVDD